MRSFEWEKLETKDFFNKLYISGSGSKNIEKNYKQNFNQRVKNVYNDKVLFLKKVLKKKINILDIGPGAGHFLKALENHKINAIGIEPNKLMCKIGKNYLKKNKLFNKNLTELEKTVLNNTEANCVSAIGVLEHLILKKAFKIKIKYLYLSLPLFSFTSLIENFQNVYPRHLSGGHTHLYTFCKNTEWYLFGYCRFVSFNNY